MYNLNCGPVVEAGASRSMPDAARPQATVGYGVDSCSFAPFGGHDRPPFQALSTCTAAV